MSGQQLSARRMLCQLLTIISALHRLSRSRCVLMSWLFLNADPVVE